MASTSGKSLAISVIDTDSVLDVKRKYSEHTGVSADLLHLTFCEEQMEDHHPLHKYRIPSGDLRLVSLGDHLGEGQDAVEPSLETLWPKPRCLAAVTSQVDDETIIVKSSKKPKYQDLRFKTIRLSCESHAYSSGAKNYAGFILYGWTDAYGKVQEDWTLNGKHCKDAYLVVQDSDSYDVKRYMGEAPGVVHGAVYWNVFGKGAEANRAVGEGFSWQNGVYGWNSGVFNANSDAYHDGRREISLLAKKCVKKIMADWMQHSTRGKTYFVKELLD